MALAGSMRCRSVRCTGLRVALLILLVGVVLAFRGVARLPKTFPDLKTLFSLFLAILAMISPSSEVAITYENDRHL